MYTKPAREAARAGVARTANGVGVGGDRMVPRDRRQVRLHVDGQPRRDEAARRPLIEGEGLVTRLLERVLRIPKCFTSKSRCLLDRALRFLLWLRKGGFEPNVVDGARAI